jgi:hypothetical protein
VPPSRGRATETLWVPPRSKHLAKNNATCIVHNP